MRQIQFCSVSSSFAILLFLLDGFSSRRVAVDDDDEDDDDSLDCSLSFFAWGVVVVSARFVADSDSTNCVWMLSSFAFVVLLLSSSLLEPSVWSLVEVVPFFWFLLAMKNVVAVKAAAAAAAVAVNANVG